MARKTRRAAPAQSSRQVSKSTYRIIKGKEVKPVMYAYPKQNTTGYRNIIAGAIDDKIIMDANGHPIPYKQLPNER